MAMFVHVQAQDQAQNFGCKIKVYRPKQGAVYPFFSRQYIEYDVSDSCMTEGGDNGVNVGVISRTTGNKVYDVVKNGNLINTPRKLRFRINPIWATDGRKYYIRVTVNRRKSAISGDFTTVEEA
ncbi:17051_t:CDS:2 [Funneliformis geosporum]|uniref:12159_t:CDS:1 n=1 Tax=Funneliformis geosporum TaxID=1117311 RepID=A0A9W4WLA6_9GLOM|nr:17051_t:CDS:2 [Funneliformis geosporum]CAI2162384.1 12159_t:CDS:2 [Funneliformis geosporum]